MFIYVLEVMDHVFSRCFKYQENVLNIVKKNRKKEYQSDLQCLSNFKTPFKGISVHETYFIILRTWQ